jgi:hypothetical protein
MRRAARLLPLALLLLLGGLLPLSARAQGPLERQVGPYLLRLSFAHPPRLDDSNALLLEVVDSRSGRPVEGLQDSLRLEGWVFPTEGARRYVPVFLRPARGQPGLYEGVFVPPALGPYRFYLLGSIEGTAVQEEFATGPGGLPEVLPPEEELFTPGAVVAFVILGLYLAGLAALGLWQLRQRRRGAATR